MLGTHRLFVLPILLALLVLPAANVAAQSQNSPAAQPKLALSAVLVLTPDFCKTHTKKGWVSEQIDIGKVACKQIGPRLKDIFSSLTTVKAVPTPGDTQVILIPRFVETVEKADAGGTLGALGHHNLLVNVEWTVKDKSGNTIWMETLQGSARKRGAVTIFSSMHAAHKLAEAALDDMLTQTVSSMTSSPELLKLSTPPVN